VLAWTFKPPLSSEGNSFFGAMETNELAGSQFSAQLSDRPARQLAHMQAGAFRYYLPAYLL